MKQSFFIVAICAGIATGASAEPGQTSVGVGLSTVGPKLELGYMYNTNIAFRGFLGVNMSQSTTETSDGVTYDVSGNLGGAGVLVDYYPTGSGFRLSGGLFSSNTSVSMNSTITAATDIGGTSYNAGTIDGKLEFNRKVSPMLAVGYDWQIGPKWSIAAELGAIANNGYKASAVAGGGIAQADLDREMQNVENDLNKTKVFPYISVMATYRF